MPPLPLDLRERGTGRVLVAVVFVCVAVLTIGLIGASPFALAVFTGATRHWERLSFIGQTYGAASAVLSVLALIGVVVTLRIQAGESKTAREHAIRQSNIELVKMAMDDPVYNECWGPALALADETRQRQWVYVNLILSQ